MNCKTCRPLLDDYIESEADEKNSRSIAFHLNECSACSSVYKSLKNEQEAYLRYFAEIETRTNLWANIQSEIVKDEQERAASTGIFAFCEARYKFGGWPMRKLAILAPALLAIVTVGVAVLMLSNLKETPSASVTKTGQNISFSKAEPVGSPDQLSLPEAAPATRFSGSRPKAVSLTLGTPKAKRPQTKAIPADALYAESEYLKAIASLTHEIRKKNSDLSQQNLQYQSSLQMVDDAIRKTRRALKNNPDNPLTVQYLTSAYARKVDLLRAVTEN